MDRSVRYRNAKFKDLYYMKKDVLFIKRINKKYGKENIAIVIDLLYVDSKLESRDRELLELFFLDMKKTLGISLFDTLVQFCISYDMDMDLLIKKTRLVKKIKAESNTNRISALF